MSGSKAKIRKYLNVGENKISTKVPARIVLDLNDYRDVDSEYGESVGIEDMDNVYKVPGFFTLEFPTEGDSIDFFFPYTIYLNKTQETTETSKRIEINFEVDDLILQCSFKDSDTDISILKSLFDNGSKYLGDKPEQLLIAIWQQLKPSSNVPIHHLELMISQLYATYDNKSKQIIPLRLTNEAYSKKYIMNLKQSAHALNESLGFTYGYTKDFLRTSVGKKKRKENSFFEDIIAGDYDAMIEKSKR